MRRSSYFTFLALVVGMSAGCGQSRPVEGPTVDAFNGRLTHDGKPVSFPPGEEIFLQVFHEKGQSMLIPIKSDGTFNIGWMQIGKFSALLKRNPKVARAAPTNYTVPGGFTITEGQTEYTIELGKGFKL
jgi:hypothetical protein